VAVSKTLYDVARSVPETDEEEWGGEVTLQLGDMLDGADEVLHKSGANILRRDQRVSSTLAASATLTQTKPVHEVQGTPGAVTLDTTTPIAAGAKDGQKLRLEGAHATNFVTILHGGTASLNGNVTLELGESIELQWDDDGSVWRETSRSN
jgi:hypothetical protein